MSDTPYFDEYESRRLNSDSPISSFNRDITGMDLDSNITVIRETFMYKGEMITFTANVVSNELINPGSKRLLIEESRSNYRGNKNA